MAIISFPLSMYYYNAGASYNGTVAAIPSGGNIVSPEMSFAMLNGYSTLAITLLSNEPLPNRYPVQNKDLHICLNIPILSNYEVQPSKYLVLDGHVLSPAYANNPQTVRFAVPELSSEVGNVESFGDAAVTISNEQPLGVEFYLAVLSIVSEGPVAIADSGGSGVGGSSSIFAATNSDSHTLYPGTSITVCSLSVEALNVSNAVVTVSINFNNLARELEVEAYLFDVYIPLKSGPRRITNDTGTLNRASKSFTVSYPALPQGQHTFYVELVLLSSTAINIKPFECEISITMGPGRLLDNHFDKPTLDMALYCPSATPVSSQVRLLYNDNNGVYASMYNLGSGEAADVLYITDGPVAYGAICNIGNLYLAGDYRRVQHSSTYYVAVRVYNSPTYVRVYRCYADLGYGSMIANVSNGAIITSISMATAYTVDSAGHEHTYTMLAAVSDGKLYLYSVVNATCTLVQTIDTIPNLTEARLFNDKLFFCYALCNAGLKLHIVPPVILTADKALFEFEYTGAVQTQVLSAGTYKLTCIGATGAVRATAAAVIGSPGISTGILILAEDTVIYVYVGGCVSLVPVTDIPVPTGPTYAGGWPNGGSRQGINCGGGGSSDIRLGVDDLGARVIVAGGSGSQGGYNVSYVCGNGGGFTGGSSIGGYGTGGTGGTQINVGNGGTDLLAQGSFYYGGTGVYQYNGYGGSGGGGWYGGGGKTPDSSLDDDGSGGGGSGFIFTGVVPTMPTGYEWKLDAKYALTNASTGTTTYKTLRHGSVTIEEL